jgi:hypothetical protein
MTVSTSTAWELRDGLENHILDMWRSTTGDYPDDPAMIHTRECHETHRQGSPIVDPAYWLNDIPSGLARLVMDASNRAPGDDARIRCCQKCVIRRVHVHWVSGVSTTREADES